MFFQVTRSYVGLTKYTPDGGRSVADSIPEPVSDILFAQGFPCPQIFPAAFHSLSLMPVTDDWGDNSDWLHRARNKPLARWSLLDRENLLRYTRGCQMLNAYRPEVSAFMCADCATWPGTEEVPGSKPVPCR